MEYVGHATIIHESKFNLAVQVMVLVEVYKNLWSKCIRGQATAMYYFIISLAGLTLGPLSVAVFTDYVFQDEAALRYSMAIVGFFAPLLSVICAVLMRHSYRQSMAEAETWDH